MNGTGSGTVSQRHPDLVGRGDQPRRRPLVREVGAQAQPDGPHSCGVEFGEVGPAAVDGVRQQQPDGQQQLAALQPGAWVGQLGDGRGLDLAVRTAASGHQLQPEVRIGDQLRNRQHGHIVEHVRSDFYKIAISL